MAVQTTGNSRKNSESGPDAMTLFLCRDVMLERGINQVLPFPGDPALHEPYMTSATGYVRLAEQVNGPIAYPAGFAYIWVERIRVTGMNSRFTLPQKDLMNDVCLKRNPPRLCHALSLDKDILSMP